MPDLHQLQSMVNVKQRERDQAVAQRDAAAQTAQPLLERLKELTGTSDLEEAGAVLRSLEDELALKITEAHNLLTGVTT